MFYKEHELQTKKGREHLPDPLQQLSFDRNKLASQNMFLKYLIVLTEVGMSRNWSENFALKKNTIYYYVWQKTLQKASIPLKWNLL